MSENTQIDKDTCFMHSQKIQELELSIVEIKGDVKHIRERIDNGLSSTVTKVWEKISEMAVSRAKLETIVAANASFLDRLKNALIWVSVTSVFGGMIALLWKLAHAYLGISA